MSDSRDQVFLSHNSADKPLVEFIAEALERSQLRPWLDKWHLTPGEAWQPAIEQALRDVAVASCLSVLAAWERGSTRRCALRLVAAWRQLMPTSPFA